MTAKNVLFFDDVAGWRPSGNVTIDGTPAINTDLVTLKASDSGKIFTLREDMATGLIIQGFDGSQNEDIRLSTSGDSWVAAGKLGVGTSSPSEELDVHSPSSTTASIAVEGDEVIRNDGTNIFVGDVNNSTHIVAIRQNGANKIVLHTNGCAIGGATTSNTRTIVSARAGARGELYLRDLYGSGSGDYTTGNIYKDGTYIRSALGVMYVAGQSDTISGSGDVLVVDHSTAGAGKVGIMTNPSYTLHVAGTSHITGAMTCDSTLTTTGTATHGNASNRLTYTVAGACMTTSQTTTRSTDGYSDPAVTSATYFAPAPILSNGSVLDSVRVICEVVDSTDNVTVGVRKINDGVASNIVAASTTAKSTWTVISGNVVYKDFDCSDHTILDGDGVFAYVTLAESDSNIMAVEFIYNARKV